MKKEEDDKDSKDDLSGFGTYWTVGIVIGALILIFLVYDSGVLKNIKIDIPDIATGTDKKTLDEEIVEKPRNMIPDTNYTCEEIFPVNVTIYKTKERTRLWEIKFSNNPPWHSDECKYTEEVGKLAGLFKCTAYYAIEGRVSKEGVIEKNLNVNYTIDLDDNHCSKTDETSVGSWNNCEVLNFKCSWDYY